MDSEHYRSALPRSIAAVFYVAGGGGETCAIKAHDFLTAHYRLKPEQLLLLVHKPGDDPAFEEHGRPQVRLTLTLTLTLTLRLTLSLTLTLTLAPR